MKNNFAISYSFLLLFLIFSFVATSQTEPRLVLPIGHTDGINSAVFSPDGKLVLTASKDKTARIYDALTGSELHILKGHEDIINSAAFSNDSKLVITSSDDKTARIFDVSTGMQLKVLTGHGDRIISAVFSLDGKICLTNGFCDNTARIYDVASGKVLRVFKGAGDFCITSAVFSPNDKLVLTAGSDGIARIYDIDKAQEIRTLTGHTDVINSAIFSSNGNLVLTASFDGTVRIYDFTTGKLLQNFTGHTDYVGSAIFSQDGDFVITKSLDKTARIYQVDTGEEIHVLEQHHAEVNSAVFSPDGKLALTASNDSTACVYDAISGNLLHVLSRDNGYLNSAVFSPDGKRIITASGDAKVGIFDSFTGKELHVISGCTEDVKSNIFSPDGRFIHLTTWNAKSHLYELNSGKELNIFSKYNDNVNFAVFSQNSEKLLTLHYDNRAIVYDFINEKILKISLRYSDFVNSASFSRDCKFILTAGDDSTARIHDLSSGNELKVFKNISNSVLSAIFNFDRNIVITKTWAGYEDYYRFFEVETGKELPRKFSNPTSISNDGRLALVCDMDSYFNFTSDVYFVSTGEKLSSLSGQTDPIKFASFSQDSKFVVTVHEDSIYSIVNIFEVESGQSRKIFKLSLDNFWGAYLSSDLKFLLTTSGDHISHVWNVESGECLYTLNYGAFFSPDGKNILTDSDHKTILWETATGKSLYTRLQLTDNDWLVYDEHYRFDGTPGAIEKLYFTCGLEVIDLAQMKDSLWVPGLVEKIMSGQEILINDKPAPKLSDLNICDLTPVIEPLEQEDKKILKYRITPRNGGIGNTEVYINGNLTYSLTPKQLKKTKEDKKEVYYLTLSTDTLQQYLTGKKNDKNPLLVKSKVKGSGIYGRGEELEIAKTTDEEKPQFYGVFIGVNEYGNTQKTANETRYRNLDYAAKDANDLSLAVEKTAANLFKSDAHIYRLTGTGNEAPTKENLQRVLAEIGEKSKASDILYIFFAGHGDIKKGKNEEGQEQDQIRFMLMNADKANPFTTSFGVEELTKWCSPQKIKAQKRVFVFDACHSGKIIDQTMAFNGRGDDEGARIRQLDKLKDKNGMMILAAAADDESAYEDETLNQGVLTYHLLQVMKEQSDTSLVVRNWFDETIDLVKDYSKANGNKQEPSSFGDGRFEIGNVNQDVREAIKITCPKTRVGACMFSANSTTKQQYPNVQKRVNEYFSSNGRGDNLVFSKNAEKAYHAQGLYLLIKDEMQITFDLYRGSSDNKFNCAGD